MLQKEIQRKQVIYFVIFILLSVYGFYTVKNYAKKIKITDSDEWIYQNYGINILNDLNYMEKAVDHPPLSIWLGSLYPVINNKLDPGTRTYYFRIAHYWLYFLSGMAIFFLLAKVLSMEYALIFYGIYLLSPNLKAFAGLHVTDFDMAIFTALSACSIWFSSFHKHLFSSKKIFFTLLWFSGFFIGLAGCSKISAFAYGPFLALAAIFLPQETYFNFKKNKLLSSITSKYLILVLGMISGIYLAFLFHPRFMEFLFNNISFQLNHNKHGHSSFLFGEHSNTGFVLYFYILFFFKTPIPILITIITGFIIAIKNYKTHLMENLVFFVPAFILSATMSLARIHIGYRYFLWLLILLMIGSTIVISRSLESKKSNHNFLIITLLILSLFAIDLNTYKRDWYISYFNIFTPNPTRNFSDSNIFWGQQLLPHIAKEVPAHKNIDLYNIFDFFQYEEDEVIAIIASATSLSGQHSKIAPYLRALKPTYATGGFEVFKTTPVELYSLLIRHDHKIPILDKFKRLEEPLKSPLCPAGTKDLTTTKLDGNAPVFIAKDLQSKYLFALESKRNIKVFAGDEIFLETNKRPTPRSTWKTISQTNQLKFRVVSNGNKDYIFSVTTINCKN